MAQKKKEEEVAKRPFETVDPDESPKRVEKLTGVDPTNAVNLYGQKDFGKTEGDVKGEAKSGEKGGEVKSEGSNTTPPETTNPPAVPPATK